MGRRFIALFCIVSLILLFVIPASYAQEEETAGAKFKKFWQELFNYPANVTDKSVDVVGETSKKGVGVVTQQVKRVGRATSGDLDQPEDLVVKPVTGVGETVKYAVEETVKIPGSSAKE